LDQGCLRTFIENGRSGYLELETEKWHTLRFAWKELNRDSCRLTIDGTFASELPLLRPSACGISYVLFQSVATARDENGFLVDKVHAVGEVNAKTKQ